MVQQVLQLLIEAMTEMMWLKGRSCWQVYVNSSVLSVLSAAQTANSALIAQQSQALLVAATPTPTPRGNNFCGTVQRQVLAHATQNVEATQGMHHAEFAKPALDQHCCV